MLWPIQNNNNYYFFVIIEAHVHFKCGAYDEKGGIRESVLHSDWMKQHKFETGDFINREKKIIKIWDKKAIHEEYPRMKNRSVETFSIGHTMQMNIISRSMAI